ncbi:hypothetical protein [Candidatus Electrothrix sp.]|uniref:hypothetical protein n=1 Tax=Candidatus Electrothrix sp. TaxID=2170559 RepID=UPI004056388A
MKRKDIIKKTATEAGISTVKAEKLVNGIAGLLLNELYNFKGNIETKYSRPHFNIIRLTEYMISTPARRQMIVKNQKRKKSLFVEYYNEASIVISKFISEEINEEGYWEECHRINNKRIYTDLSEVNQSMCIFYLEEFEKIIYDVQFDKYKKKTGKKKQQKAMLHRLKLEVNPEVLLCDNNGKTNGAVKLIFDNKPKEKLERDYLSTLLLQYMKLLYGVHIKNTDCYIIDIFGGVIDTAPASCKKIMLDIKAACDEIKDTWKRV